MCLLILQYYGRSIKKKTLLFVFKSILILSFVEIVNNISEKVTISVSLS